MFRSAARSLIHPESQSAPAGLSFCYDVQGCVLSTCRWKLDEDILLTLDYKILVFHEELLWQNCVC